MFDWKDILLFFTYGFFLRVGLFGMLLLVLLLLAMI